jgi:hypothetical protein
LFEPAKSRARSSLLSIETAFGELPLIDGLGMGFS